MCQAVRIETDSESQIMICDRVEAICKNKTKALDEIMQNEERPNMEMNITQVSSNKH